MADAWVGCLEATPAGCLVDCLGNYLADSKAAWLAYAMVALSVFQKAVSMVDMMG